MSCIRALCDHTPYQANTPQGKNAAMAKRLVIGLVATVAIAVGLYFLDMALGNVWNPWNFTQQTQMGLAIAGSVFVGLIGIGATGIWAFSAKVSADQ